MLSTVKAKLAVGADGFPAYLLKIASPDVQGLYLDAWCVLVRACAGLGELV